MLARLCQLKSLRVKSFGAKSLSILSLIAVSACTQIPERRKVHTELLSTIKNEWFSKNREHGLWDQKEKPLPHQFFDVDPQFTTSEATVNSVILTPEDSRYSYLLDLVSGQRYYSHSFCPQHDIWKRYKGAISLPTFSTGIIPRFLDQLGEPQKVIIFGGAEKFTRLIHYREHNIRLVGAFVEHSCPIGNCSGTNKWLSSLVFVAVDPEDPVFGGVEDIASLKGKINWVKQRAIYENLDGRNGAGGLTFPSIRGGELIPLEEAINFYKKQSIVITVPESNKIRSTCHALYEKLWRDVGIERPEDRPAKTTAELNSKIKLINELKKKKKPVGFAARFSAFTSKFFNEYNTCSKFVYAGNINHDHEKFWFLSYIGMFYRLHKDGFYYNCKRKSWQENVVNNQVQQSAYDIKSDLSECKDEHIDHAMETLPNFLTGLKSGGRNYYKFVDYDSRKFGTHQKIYSWVKVKSRSYDCNFDPNENITKETKAFPEDVSWKSRKVKDISDKLEIIY